VSEDVCSQLNVSDPLWPHPPDELAAERLAEYGRLSKCESPKSAQRFWGNDTHKNNDKSGPAGQ
jgi:hypothetical protein